MFDLFLHLVAVQSLEMIPELDLIQKLCLDLSQFIKALAFEVAMSAVYRLIWLGAAISISLFIFLLLLCNQLQVCFFARPANPLVFSYVRNLRSIH